MTVGSLFSGIGGLDLGLERAGHRVVWSCESNPYCRRVLPRTTPFRGRGILGRGVVSCYPTR